MNNVIFYSNFKDSFVKFFESEEYEKMLFMCDKCNQMIKSRQQFDVHSNNVSALSFQEKVMLVNDFFRNEKNSFSKNVAILDVLMPSNSFETILEKYEVDTEEFIKMVDKHLLLTRIKKTNPDEKQIRKILTKLQDLFDIKSESLCIYKIYEIQVLKELQKEKVLS